MGHRAVAIILAGFSTVFVAFSVRYSYGILLPEMISSLGISKTQAGIIYSSYFLVYTLLAPVLGLLGDRTDARGLLTVFVAILGLGALLMSYPSTVVQASIFFALAGIGTAACWAPVVTVVLRWVGEKRRGLAVSLVDLGSTVSIAFWSLSIPWIIGPYGWRTVWMLLGITGFVVAGMNFFLVRSRPPIETRHPGSAGPPKAKTPIREAYRAILRDKRFYLIGASYALISFSILIPFVFLTAYATQELGIPYASAAALTAVIGIAGAVGKLVLAHVSDRAGRIRVMMLCGVLTAAGGLGLASASGYAVLVVFTAVFGVGYGTIWPVYAACARDLFPEDYAGSILGLWTVCHGLGSVLAPVLAGWAIDASGAYFWAFLMSVISSIISMLLLVPIARVASTTRQFRG